MFVQILSTPPQKKHPLHFLDLPEVSWWGGEGDFFPPSDSGGPVILSVSLF